jgi:hypothetical protein
MKVINIPKSYTKHNTWFQLPGKTWKFLWTTRRDVGFMKVDFSMLLNEAISPEEVVSSRMRQKVLNSEWFSLGSVPGKCVWTFPIIVMTGKSKLSSQLPGALSRAKRQQGREAPATIQNYSKKGGESGGCPVLPTGNRTRRFNPANRPDYGTVQSTPHHHNFRLYK